MKWFKIDFNDVFLNGLTSAEVGCVVKYKCMCQQLGVDELDMQRMKSIFTSRELKFVLNYFKVCSKSDEVCSDFAEVCSKNAKVCSKKDSKNKDVSSSIYNIYNTDKIEKKEERDNIPPISPQGEHTQIDLEEAIAKTKRFTKPTAEEITAYCEETDRCIDAERFLDYYNANGWKVGKNPMKDWKAAVRNWTRDSKPVAKASNNDECWF